MLRVQTFPCSLAKAEADALNRASGRHYTTTLVWHDRVSRRTRRWLSEGAAHKLEEDRGGPTILHAHRRDAAQQGVYDACNVARSQRPAGLDLRAPYRRHFFRTTAWKHTGIRVREGVMVLSRAQG